jgi:NAD(P)-dependent dehydrogenase (short-subunit alcohol dehydrogenase family)
VRVNAVCPGTVLTPMVEAATQMPGLEEQLVALEDICLIPCEEYGDLKRAIAAYKKLATR